jgi:hypothetical protein
VKAYLEFDLSTEDGRQDHLNALQGAELRLILWEMDAHMRSILKYDDKRTQKEIKLLEELRQKMWESLNERQIDL